MDSASISKLRENIVFFNQQKNLLSLKPLFVRSKSAIQSAIIPGNEKVKTIANQLHEKGFDVSDFTLAKYNPEKQQGFLIVRYMDTFLMAKLESFIDKMMPPELKITKKNTKPHWKFTVAENPAYHIVNTQNKELRYRLQEPSKKQIVSYFNKM